MTKKSIRIVALLLLLCIMPSFVIAAEADVDYTDKIDDSDFEKNFEYFWQSETISGATYEWAKDKDKVNNGNGSLHISNSSSVDSNVNQAAQNLTTEMYYTLSVYINANIESGEGAGAGVTLKYFDVNNVEIHENTLHPALYDEKLTNTNNRFIAYQVNFYMPKGAEKVRIYLCVSGKGEAWFDDVTLKSSPAPQTYSFDTNKVFHYKEETHGYAFAKIDPYYKDSAEAGNALADFAVYKANADDDDSDDVLCEEKTGVTFTNLEAGFKYRTDNWVPYDKYILKCKIKNNGVLLEEYEQNLYRVDRPSMMSEDGYLLVDGERFNPILGCHATEKTKTYYHLAKEAGMNTVQITSTGADDWQKMQEEELKGILCLYRKKTNGTFEDKCAGSDYNIEYTKKFVNMVNYGVEGVQIVSPESFIGFAIIDEPFLDGDNSLMREYCERAYLEIRKIDKVHPIYIWDKRNDHISAKYCDIYCIDSYAAGKNTSAVSRETANAWAATEDKNGFWELAATYYTGTRMPTMNAARNSVWRAFEEGARGIGYMGLSDAMKGRPGYDFVGDSQDKLELDNWDEWDKLCTFNKEEVPILFDYFVNEKGTPFNDRDDGNGHYSVKWFSWLSGDDMYLAIHNRSQEEKTIIVPLQNKDETVSIIGFQAEPIGLTTQSAQNGIGEISVTLDSEEIALYKIIPQKKKITIQRSYDAETVTLICGIYAHEGNKKQLINLAMTEETSQNGETVNVASTIELPGTACGKSYTLEVMAWDMHSMQPLDKKDILK